MIRMACLTVAAGALLLAGCGTPPPGCIDISSSEKAQLRSAARTGFGAAANEHGRVIFITPTLFEASGNTPDGVDYFYREGEGRDRGVAGDDFHKIPSDLQPLIELSQSCYTPL